MSNDQKISKILFSFKSRDGKDYSYLRESSYQDGLDNVRLPFDVGQLDVEKLSIKLFGGMDAAKCDAIENEYGAKYLVNMLDEEDEDEKAAKDSLEEMREKSILLKNLNGSYFENGEDGIAFPSISYADTTEQELLGQEQISEGSLIDESKGVWTYYGLRRFRILLDRVLVGREVGKDDYKVSFYWYKAHNTTLGAKVFERTIRHRVTMAKVSDEEKEVDEFIAYVDTDALGRVVENVRGADADNALLKMLVKGRFEIHIINAEDKEAYSFPVDIVLQKADPANVGLVDELNNVSIDFGTSSTCAAAIVGDSDKPRLFTLSGIEKRDSDSGDNRYENPTNIQLFNWDEMRRQWDKSNEDVPFLTSYRDRGDFANQDEQFLMKRADFDSGYKVDDVLKALGDVNSSRKINAIIRKLKFIPFELGKGANRKLEVSPYFGGDIVSLTDDVAKEGDLVFNPIAFYGYLLGRAINNPANGKIFTQYLVSHPVKFATDQRDKLRESLKYGIKRALPQHLRELVEVRDDYSEPACCIGSIIGRGDLLPVPDPDGEPQYFAIYDLGGGTLDFAFGAFRRATDDEEDEYDCEYVVDYYVEGDSNIGGESLIHELSYKLYLDSNRQESGADFDGQMEKKLIKFVKPLGYDDPKGFDGLIAGESDKIAAANLNTLNEQLARPLFQYSKPIVQASDIFKEQTFSAGTDSVTVNLKDADKADVDVLIKITDIDAFLRDKIAWTIETFCEKMEKAFKRYATFRNMPRPNESEITVFLGGNASKQKFVGELLNVRDEGAIDEAEVSESAGEKKRKAKGANRMKFKDVKFIKYVPDGVDKDNDQYITNTKTATAFGQLAINGEVHFNNLGALDQETGGPQFLFNVVCKKFGKSVTVIEYSSTERGWKPANRINATTGLMDLFVTDSPDAETRLRPLNENVREMYEKTKKKFLYVRIAGHNSIEYRLGAKGEPPNDDEVPDEKCVINLNDFLKGGQ